jgi:dTMP kinase
MRADGGGLFVTFEGLDGSGKSTQMRMLGERLKAEGYDVIETVEPGGTPIGAQIRRVLLDAGNSEITPTVELLLYFASRAQNVGQVIRPALGRGAIVLSDRYTDSTLAYQGHARGLGEEIVRELHRIACGGLDPDVTVYLAIDVKTGLARIRSRNHALEGEAASETRMDDEADAFHDRVRQGYERLIRGEPGRFRVIDGNGPVETVAAGVWAAVQPLLAGHRV